MMQKQKIYRLALGAALLSLQFLFFIPGAEAQNNTPTNNTAANEQGRYVGRGVEASIRRLLCAPSDTVVTPTVNGAAGTNVAAVNPAGQDLSNCINRGYRFALAFGAVAAVFFFVLAGYMYMVGGENGKHEAKNVIISVIVGFLIMLSSFVLLQQINPTLVSFRTIQPPQLGGKYGLLPDCGSVGLGENCVLMDGTVATGDGQGGGIAQVIGGGCSTKESGGCTKQRIQNLCPEFASYNSVDDALKACNQESAGGQVAIVSGTDKCKMPDGSKLGFSIGLWQINMLDSVDATIFPECFSNGQRALIMDYISQTECGFSSNGRCIVKQRYCHFGPRGQAGYEACKAALADPDRNTKNGCKLFKNRSSNKWAPWPHTRDVCKLPRN